MNSTSNTNVDIFNGILDATKGLASENLSKVLDSLVPQSLWLAPKSRVEAFKKVLERVPDLTDNRDKAKVLILLKQMAELSDGNIRKPASA